MEELINRFFEVLGNHPLAVCGYTALCIFLGHIFGKSSGYNAGFEEGKKAGLESDEKCQNCNKHTINQFYGGK